MTRQPYPSDLTQAELALIEPLIPGPKPGGRPREVDIREILNPTSTSWARAVSGATYLMIFQLGKVSMLTNDAGSARGFGSRSTTACASKCGLTQDEQQNPVLE